MRQLLLVIIFIVAGVIAWRIADSLSSDAIGLAVGVVFGVLAGLPTALLVLSGNRRDRNEERDRRQPQQMAGPYGNGGQPPIIVLAAPGMQPQAGLPEQNNAQPVSGASMPRPKRHFEFVGVQEAAVDEVAVNLAADRPR